MSCCGCYTIDCVACNSNYMCLSDSLTCKSTTTTTYYDGNDNKNSSLLWISIVLFAFLSIFIVISIIRARNIRRMKMLNQNDGNYVSTSTTSVGDNTMTLDSPQQPYMMPQYVMTNPNQPSPQFSYVFSNNSGTNNVMPQYVITNPNSMNPPPQYILTNTGVYVQQQQPGMNVVDPSSSTYYSNQ